MPAKILVVDDERDLAQLVSYTLRKGGHDTILAYDGASALRRIREDGPELVILDLMLPDISGLEVLRQLRDDPERSATPVLMLTARGEEEDRVRGLEAGADDYLAKPFSPRELALRVEAILRRLGRSTASTERLRQGPIEVDLGRHRVLVEGEEAPLTALEFKLLVDLMERRGRVQTREALLDRVWGYSSFVTSRTVDTHIKRLREKLGAAADLVETIRGVGYRFSDGSEG